MIVIAVGRAITAISGLAVMALLTRHLGPDGFGEYRTILAYTSFAYLTSDLGLYSYTLRAISEPGARKGLILATALKLRLILAMLFLLVAMAVSLAMPFSPVVQIGIALAALGYLCHSGSDLLLAAFQGELRQYQYSATEVVGSLVNLSLAYIVVAYDFGVLEAVMALVGGFIVTLAANLSMLRHALEWGAGFDRAELKRMLIGSLPFAGALVFGLIYSKLDIVFLSFFHSARDVGVYGVSHKISDVAIALPYFFAGLVLPALTAAASNQVDHFRHILSRAYLAMCIGGVGTILIIGLFADVFINILAGADYVSGASALQIIGVKIGVFFIANMLVFATTALGMQGDMLKGHGYAAAISVVAYFTLIPLWSYDGAAISAAAAEVVVLLYAMYLVSSRVGWVTTPGVLLKCVAAAAVSYALVVGSPVSATHWFVQLVFAGTIYLVFVVVFRAGAWNAFMEVLRR